MTRASEREAEEKWTRFTDRIREEHYTGSQIKKIIHNLDKKKQYSALHYAVWYNNLYLVQRLLEKKSKFSSGNCSLTVFIGFILVRFLFLFLIDTDVNILSGTGEHALHIVAQSKAIWTSEESNEAQSAKRVSRSFCFFSSKFNLK